MMGGFLIIRLLFHSGPTVRGLELIGENWLVVIFQIISGQDPLAVTRLSQTNLLDITILILTGISFLGLYFSLKKSSRIWSLVGLALPFLGIVVFLLTKTAGRSAFMAAILVFSAVLFKSKLYGKGVAVTGLLAGILLFLGDFTASGPQSVPLVILFALGYLLAIVWLLLIAYRLLSYAPTNVPSE